jgi:hypothetical protein
LRKITTFAVAFTAVQIEKNHIMTQGSEACDGTGAATFGITRMASTY